VSSPTKRGRPSLIDDAALGQRFSRLLDTLERQWSSFAWELQRAKNLKALRESLQPIRERPGLELFVLESPQTTTLTELRQSRICLSSTTIRSAAPTISSEARRAITATAAIRPGQILPITRDQQATARGIRSPLQTTKTS
jgi:hypothetical protein